jgi:dTMP kinase
VSGTTTPEGRLIAICGIDGSGKTTQTDLLADRVKAEGHRVRPISFPRYGEGFFADLIERYLSGEFAPRAGEVSPYLAALPYACDRWEAASRVREWLGEGSVVVCNRYVPANMAHQGSKMDSSGERGAFYEWVEALEYGVFDLPRPDLHVLLEMPVEVAMCLVRGRGETERLPAGRDIHESDADHLERTASAYREIAARSQDAWAVISCAEGGAALAPSEIADRVWAKVRGVL